VAGNLMSRLSLLWKRRLSSRAERMRALLKLASLMKTGYGSAYSGLCIRRILLPRIPHEDIHPG
jgi:hypothetical protein